MKENHLELPAASAALRDDDNQLMKKATVKHRTW